MGSEMCIRDRCGTTWHYMAVYGTTWHYIARQAIITRITNELGWARCLALARVVTRVTGGLGGLTELHCLLLLAWLFAWVAWLAWLVQLAWVAWVAWVASMAVDGTGHWYGHHPMAVHPVCAIHGTAGTALQGGRSPAGGGRSSVSWCPWHGHGMAWHGLAWHGLAGPGLAWHGMAWDGLA